MSRTENVLSKLSKTDFNFLLNRKEAYKRTEKKDVTRAEIRGYLACLRGHGYITDTEFRLLLIYATL